MAVFPLTEDEMFEAFDEADEAFDEADEAFDEAARPRGFRRSQVSVARGTPASPQRPAGNYVTQTQLQTAVARLTGQITTNSRAIKAVESRTNTIGAEQTRQSAALRKEIADRKKATDGLRNDLQQTKQIAALLPLISQPSSIQAFVAPTSGAPATQQAQVLVASNNTLNTLLPLLLLTGDSSSGSGGGLLGGSDSTTTLLVLALALGGIGR